MAVTLEIPFRASVPSHRSPEETFAFLSDAQASLGQQFPGLRRFVETSPGVHAWEFEEVGFQSIKLKIAFHTMMAITPPNRVDITPGEEPHRLSLHWLVRPEDHGAVADLKLNFTVEIPVPGLMKGLVSGFAKTELTKLLERYTANVEKALST